jgi:ribosomal protein S18 acetylase RimI-like enzyme
MKYQQAKTEALTIRAATPEDQNQVVALWSVCNLVASGNDPVGDFQLALGRNGSDILICEDADGVVSTVMVGHDGHRGWIYYLATHPSKRQQGLGRKMVQAAEGWLVERAITKINLMIRETNLEVMRFYEQLGFLSIPIAVMQKRLRKHL